MFCLCFLFFFFFKQNTAYEMRISDWSSDVCSSDLRRRACPTSAPRRDRSVRSFRGVERRDRSVRSFRSGRSVRSGPASAVAGHAGWWPEGPGEVVGLRLPEDRKSVVSGKSVAVRVDLGCCRNIKKKKKTNKY